MSMTLSVHDELTWVKSQGRIVVVLSTDVVTINWNPIPNRSALHVVTPSAYIQYRRFKYIWVIERVSYKKQELLTIREHMGSPPLFCGSLLLIFLVFLCYPIFA